MDREAGSAAPRRVHGLAAPPAEPESAPLHVGLPPAHRRPSSLHAALRSSEASPAAFLRAAASRSRALAPPLGPRRALARRYTTRAPGARVKPDGLRHSQTAYPPPAQTPRLQHSSPTHTPERV